MSFRETILQETFKIFQKNGIEHVKSDSLLHKLDISKSTFREIADTREELVELCVESTVLNCKAIMSQSINKSTTATDGILSLIKPFLSDIQETNIQFIKDLQTDYPEAWNILMEFFNDYCFKYFQELFTKGIENGEFNTDLNAEVVTSLFLAQISAVFSQSFIPENSNRENILKAAILIFLRGLSTSFGNELIGQNKNIILRNQEYSI